LLVVGILTGVVTRTLVGSKAYGPVADGLLAITGAFAVDRVFGVLIDTTMTWADSAVFTIWGGAEPPLLAHFVA